MLAHLKTWAKNLKRDILALYLAGRDGRVPWYAKAMAISTVAYALSPIDLIPDFIPILGYLDDLIILPVMIVLTVKMIPSSVMADLRAEAALRLQNRLLRSRVGLIIILVIWVAVAALAWWAFAG